MDNRQIFLRPLELRDGIRMLEWMHCRDITRFLRLDGDNATEETVAEFIKSAADESVNLHRAIADETDTYLGTISLKNIVPNESAEYAIVLHPEALGSGAAREATQKILDVAFRQLGLKSVYLNVISSNIRAVRFYEKMNFKREKATRIIIKQKEYELHWFLIERSR